MNYIYLLSVSELYLLELKHPIDLIPDKKERNSELYLLELKRWNPRVRWLIYIALNCTYWNWNESDTDTESEPENLWIVPIGIETC